MRQIQFEGHTYEAQDDGENLSCKGCAFDTGRGPTSLTGCVLMERPDSTFYDVIGHCNSEHGGDAQVIWIKVA